MYTNYGNTLNCTIFQNNMHQKLHSYSHLLIITVENIITVRSMYIFEKRIESKKLSFTDCSKFLADSILLVKNSAALLPCQPHFQAPGRNKDLLGLHTYCIAKHFHLMLI